MINSLYLGQILKVIKPECYLYEKPFGKKIANWKYNIGTEIGLSNGETKAYKKDGKYIRFVQLFTAGKDGKVVKAWVDGSLIMAVSPLNKNNNQVFINSLIIIDQAIYLNLLNAYRKMLALHKAGIKIPQSEFNLMISTYRRLMERQQKIEDTDEIEVKTGFPASKMKYQQSWYKTLDTALNKKVNGLGIIPVIVIIIVAVVAIGATVAIYELLRPDYEDSKSDFRLSKDLDEKLKQYLPKDVYEQLQEEGEKEVDDAYNAGKTKQKIADIWGFVKYPVLIVGGFLIGSKIISASKNWRAKK